MKTETLAGKCSTFGGPSDTGMGPTEGVAVYPAGSADPWGLFKSESGRLGHDLDPGSNYCAMRWNPKLRTHEQLVDTIVRVTNPRTGVTVLCHPADWGPAEWTGRVIDLSPGAAEKIGVQTDDEVNLVLVWQD